METVIFDLPRFFRDNLISREGYVKVKALFTDVCACYYEECALLDGVEKRPFGPRGVDEIFIVTEFQNVVSGLMDKIFLEGKGDEISHTDTFDLITKDQDWSRIGEFSECVLNVFDCYQTSKWFDNPGIESLGLFLGLRNALLSLNMDVLSAKLLAPPVPPVLCHGNQ